MTPGSWGQPRAVGSWLGQSGRSGVDQERGASHWGLKRRHLEGGMGVRVIGPESQDRKWKGLCKDSGGWPQEAGMGDDGTIPTGSLAHLQLPFRCLACNLLLELLDLQDILGVWQPLLTVWQISLILGRHVSADPLSSWGWDITTPDLSFSKWHLVRKLASLQDPEPVLSSCLHLCALSRVSLSLRCSDAGWTGDSRALTLPILDSCPT